MKIAGGAIVSGAANATSGISAIKAAFEQAQSIMAGSETTQNRSAEFNTDSGNSPFSKAAGFDNTDRSSVSPKLH